MPCFVTKVPYQVMKVPFSLQKFLKVPYLVTEVRYVRLQKHPMLPKFPFLVTNTVFTFKRLLRFKMTEVKLTEPR